MSVSTLPTPQERIDERIREVVGELNRAHARLVDVTAEALQAELWTGHGIVSANHWLVLRAGLSRGRARQVLSLARRVDELPVTMGLLRQGQLSLEQALPIAAHVPAEYEESVADLALYATVPQISRTTSTTEFPDAAQVPDVEGQRGIAPQADAQAQDFQRGHGEALRPPVGPAEGDAVEAPSGADASGADASGTDLGSADSNAELCSAASPPVRPVGWYGPAPASDPPRLTMHHDRGRFYLRFDAPSHVGVLVENAIREARDALWRSASGVDDETPGGDESAEAGAALPDPGSPTNPFQLSERPGVTLADGLAALARAHIEGLSIRSRRDAYRVYVHLDTDGGWLTGRPRLPRHVVNQLTCDGVLHPVWESEGSPVNVGRSQRTVPVHVRRLIHNRDRGCRFPGCPAADAPGRHVDVHHIRHWRDGGPTDLANLVSLCPAHHEAQHRGLFTMRGDPNLSEQDAAGLRFFSHGGWQIRAEPPPSGGQARRPAAASHGTCGGRAGRLEQDAVLAVTEDTRPRSPSDRLETPSGQPYAGPTGEPLIARWVTFSPSIASPEKPKEWEASGALPPWSAGWPTVT